MDQCDSEGSDHVVDTDPKLQSLPKWAKKHPLMTVQPGFQYLFNVGYFNLEIDHQQTNSWLERPDIVEKMSWQILSKCLKHAATSYYNRLSPIWPSVPSRVRNAVGVAFVMRFPYVADRYRVLHEEALLQGNCQRRAGPPKERLYLEEELAKRIDRRRYDEKTGDIDRVIVKKRTSEVAKKQRAARGKRTKVESAASATGTEVKDECSRLEEEEEDASHWEIGTLFDV